MVTTRNSKRRLSEIVNSEYSQKSFTSFAPKKRPRSITSKCEVSKIHTTNDQKLLDSGCFADVARYFSLSFETKNLHTVGREREISYIAEKLNNWYNEQQPTSLYLCGSPGTGKSFSLKTVLDNVTAKSNNPVNIQVVSVNCASLREPKSIYSLILSYLNGGISESSTDMKFRLIQHLQQMNDCRILLILEEADFLVTRDMSVLCSLLQCPHLVNSNFCVISTANSIELPQRTMPWLKMHQATPETMTFSPYSYEEIEQILFQRLDQARKENALLTQIPQEIFMTVFKLVGKKISGYSGDIRVALDIIRTLFVELARKKVTLATLSTENGRLLQEVLKILEEKSGLTSMRSRIMGLPIQQQLVVLACLLLSSRQQVFNMNDVYTKVCRIIRELNLPSVSFSQFVDICETSLTQHGVIQMERKAQIDKRRKRCSLLCSFDEARAALEQYSIYLSYIQNSQ
eukprot:jgi/Galph1/3291/GphlegSOOS_G1947.1